MAGLVGTGGPPSLIAFPCMVIYIKLMKQITSRPVANGLNIDKEKVIQGTIPLLTKFHILLKLTRKKTNLMTAGDTMTLIIIMSVMGVTSTLTNIGPFLSIPMTTHVRLNINYLVQILICMVETAETIQRQVIMNETLTEID